MVPFSILEKECCVGGGGEQCVSLSFPSCSSSEIIIIYHTNYQQQAEICYCLSASTYAGYPSIGYPHVWFFFYIRPDCNMRMNCRRRARTSVVYLDSDPAFQVNPDSDLGI
jgi:hypothetical protein